MKEMLLLSPIGIRCPYPIQELTELTITSSYNDHGKAVIAGILAYEERDKCIETSTSNDPLDIYEITNSGEAIHIFSGVVTSLEVSCQAQVYYVYIEAKTRTFLMDNRLKRRSFQDKKAFYKNVIDQVIAGYPEAAFIHMPEDRPTDTMLVQYDETDWRFLKRLATHFNTVLIPDTLGDSPRFWLGIHRTKKEFIAKTSYVADFLADRYRYMIAHGFNVSPGHFMRYEVESSTFLRLGDKVSYMGGDCFVEEYEAVFNRDRLIYKYTLGREYGSLETVQYNQQLNGLAIMGRVLARQDSSIKAHLAIDESQDVSKACWIPYAPQTNNLFYCMPEVGENIYLYFANAIENEAIAISSVRSNGGKIPQTSDPHTKYMSIPSGQGFKLSPTDLEFFGHKSGLFISMDKGKGLTIQSPDDLILYSQGKLSLEAKKKITFHANKGKTLVGAGPKGDKSQIYLEGGAAGNAHIFTKGKMHQEGSKRQKFLESLNNDNPPAEPPKKQFSWGKLALGVLAGMAAVALVVATAGAGAALLGASAVLVKSVMIGAAISGTIAVASIAASDIISGENSSEWDFFKSGLKGGTEGAVSGAAVFVAAPLNAALVTQKAISPAVQLFGKAGVSGATGFVTDAIMQTPAIFRGEYDPKRGLTSLAIGSAMPLGAKGLQKVFAKGPQCLKKPLCVLAGEPIDVATGAMQYEVTDFELPGPLPLVWNRTWYSDSSHLGHLGHGTRCSLEMGLDIYEEYTMRVYLADGRVAAFPHLLVGEEQFNARESLFLKREADHYRLFDPENRYSYLFYPSDGGYMEYKLGCIHNPQGHKIEIAYNPKGHFSTITDSAGRRLDVTTNGVGRITEVSLGDRTLVKYRYNREEDLTEVIDALGQTTKMNYQDHLMISKTDRNKNTFYWHYEKSTATARVSRSWGGQAGYVMGVELAYHQGHTAVTDSQKYTTKHYFDDRNLCTKTIYADRTQTNREYNEYYQLIKEIDEEGRVTFYTHNHHSQLTGITRPDGSKLAFTYDDKNRLTTMTNPTGASQHWVYNEDDTLAARIDETGAKTTFTYNENKLTETVTNAKGDTVSLAYDQDYNLCQVTLPDETTINWTYDHLGNCLEETNPQGAANKYRYDVLNRLVKANLADGNNIELQYNGYQEVVHAKDNHTQVAFEYTILGSLKTRTQGDRKVSLKYDNEERLVAIVNEREEEYRLQRDLKGNVITETGFDQATRNFVRDNSGLVTEIVRPGNRYTKYQHDKLGNITRADYHDHTWDTFEYDKNDQLIQAANKHTKVRFQRDQAGQIVKEWQGDHWIASGYDELGYRQEITSSLGAKIISARKVTGQITHLTAAQTGQPAWVAKMEYNSLGQEIKRLLPGEVISSWQYDATGRPIHHQVQNLKKDLRQREYQWDVNHRLKKITNLLNQNQIAFDYDLFSNLISSNQNNSWSFMHRRTDNVGNLYETTTLTDRIYASGSKLTHTKVNTNELKNIYQGGHGKLVTKGTEFSYDEEGNLTRKTQANGDVWQYYYYGNGMMSKVIRPDNTVISFKYDSLGRRIEKKTPERTKHFVWDGNKPLHEWEDENLITWVFDDGYAPVAKLTAQGNYSIIADHLGTPAEAYDADGNCVWSAELDIFGRVKEFTGEVDFIPFRYQGQYNDLETGLYYNRFRYYSPEEGGYTQPDPIGLAGKNPTLYGYVWDPNWLVDIFGLSPLRDSLINAGQGLSVPWQAHHAIPNQVWNENLSFFNRIGFTGQHSVSNGLALPVSQTGAIQTGHSYFHSGPHANYSADIRHQVGDVRLRYENALRGGTDPKNAAQNAVRDLNTVQSRAKNNLGTRNGGNPCRLS